jgi:pimeloyl-ACP methyl ester carboxylesterase
MRGWFRLDTILLTVCTIAVLTAPLPAAVVQVSALVPPPVKDAGLVLKIESVGRMPAATNAASPVPARGALLLIDQKGSLYRWDGTATQPMLSATMPAGLKPMGGEALLNVAASDAGNAVFVVFTSSSVPRGVPTRKSTRPGADSWQVFYRFDFDGAALSNAKPIVAIEVRSDGHTGGGLAVLADESLLFATGDNGDAGEDGRAFAQDPSSHLGKILRIQPKDGSVTVVAAGVRNTQRLTIGAREGEAWLDFVDMGGSVAEEFNSIRVVDLLRAGPIRNFGWGRSVADGKTREGTFYIGPDGVAQAAVASDEPAFVSPVAQFGREAAKAFGGSGSVSSSVSFRRISALFADLPSGLLFATTGSRAAQRQDVFRVALVDKDAKPVTLLQLAKGDRADPRLFSFPDGSAGVLIETTGEFFRLTEVAADPPAPAGPRDGFFDSNGVRIHYVEQGSGPAVVLVHEIDSSIRTWMTSGIFQNLARDHRVVAMDVRGHGLSGKPQESAAYGPELAKDISRLLDHLSIPRAHVVGYSMGAEILAMLLVTEPQRVATATLIAGAGRFRKLPTDDQHMEEEALEYLNIGVSPKLFLEESPENTPDPTNEELRVLAATALADPGRDVRALAAFSRARPARMIPAAQAGAVRVPTLGLAGSLDPELESLRALQGLRPDITLTVIDGATHSGPKRALDRPQFLAALRAFLDAHRF